MITGKTTTTQDPAVVMCFDEDSDVTCPRCGGPAEMVDWGIPGGKPRKSLACNRCARKSEELWQADKRESFRMGIHRGLMPPGVESSTFKASRPEFEEPHAEAYKAVSRWCQPENGYRGLFLFGPTGTGKTYLARCALNATLDRLIPAGEVVAGELVKAADSYAEADKAFYQAAASVSVILVDDVDKIPKTDKALLALFAFMNKREKRGRQTIITGNLDKAALVAFFIECDPTNSSKATATLERLRPCLSIAMGGPSMRPKGETVE